MLEIEELYKSYKKNLVLKGVNLSVEDGAVMGLIGINGAGKSTLIECVCGVKRFDSGKILINGLDITDRKNKKSIKNLIGYMPQNFGFFNDLTVEENLKYLCAIYGLEKDTAEETIENCFLQTHRKTLAKNLSGGYRQLLSMACATIHNPKFIILDEPTSSIDPIFRRKFWNVVQKYKNNNSTILIITHYMEELLECDCFCCLNEGKIVYKSSVEEIKKQNNFSIELLLRDLI